jgi:hypothetical protein
MPYAEGDKKGSYITSASEVEPPKHQKMPLMKKLIS